jgi:hypothetical protein
VDNEEARAILASELDGYDKRPYDELVALIGAPKVTKKVDGHTGVRYQVETRVVWDGEKGGDIRVLGAIDDGDWRAFVPLSNSILKGPA